MRTVRKRCRHPHLHRSLTIVARKHAAHRTFPRLDTGERHSETADYQLHEAPSPPRAFASQLVTSAQRQPIEDRPAARLRAHRRRCRAAAHRKRHVAPIVAVPAGVHSHQRYTDPAPAPTLFAHEFSLADRVALVSGGNRGLGLEMALALVEAGARAVYCVDLAKEPSAEWEAVRAYAARLQNKGGEGRLEYVSGDVTDQVRAGATQRVAGADRCARRPRCGRLGRI